MKDKKSFPAKKSFRLSFLLILAAAVFFLAGCSLKYEESVSVETSVPEMIAEDTLFSRTEDGKKIFQLNAKRVEQYKQNRFSYAQEPSFKVFDKNEKISSEGRCGFLSADTEKEEYVLLDNILISDKNNKVDIIAKSLKWNGKTEQLTSQKGEDVVLKKDDFTFTGKDFSASAVSSSFAFGGDVSGVINTDDSEAGATVEK